MAGQPPPRAEDAATNNPATNSAGISTELVLANALEAFVYADGEGRILAWNPAAERAFGYSAQEAVGRLIEDLIVAERLQAGHRAGLARLAAGEPGRVLAQRLQLPARHKDGHEFDVELTLNA